MHTITTADNKKVQVECIACAIAKHEVEVPGGMLWETEFFQAAHDFEIPIPGFVIVSSKRHFTSVADFTGPEAADFTRSLVKVRRALKEAADGERITLVQEEKTGDSHFHIWLFPWQDWMNKMGSDLSAIRPILEFARANHKTDEILREISGRSEKIRKTLSS